MTFANCCQHADVCCLICCNHSEEFTCALVSRSRCAACRKCLAGGRPCSPVSMFIIDRPHSTWGLCASSADTVTDTCIHMQYIHFFHRMRGGSTMHTTKNQGLLCSNVCVCGHSHSNANLMSIEQDFHWKKESFHTGPCAVGFKEFQRHTHQRSSPCP